MGRCYEFGVLVGEGCEHAMVVPDTGGRCECATCGVGCTGKFAACSSIIDQPGYVPITAPAWAVEIGDRRPDPPDRSSEPTTPAEPPARTPPDDTVPGGPLAAERSAASLPAAADAVELIEAVAKQLAEHDTELANRIDALAEQLAEFQNLNAQYAAAIHADLAELTRMVRDLDEARPGPLFGFPRRPL